VVEAIGQVPQKSTLSFLTLMVPGESFSVTVNSVRLGMVFGWGSDRAEE